MAHTQTHTHAHQRSTHLGRVGDFTGHWHTHTHTHTHTNVVHTLGGWVTSLVMTTSSSAHLSAWCLRDTSCFMAVRKPCARVRMVCVCVCVCACVCVPISHLCVCVCPYPMCQHTLLRHAYILKHPPSPSIQLKVVKTRTPGLKKPVIQYAFGLPRFNHLFSWS